jgi:hypothetical protein
VRFAFGILKVGKSPERCAKPREHKMVKNALLCFVFVLTGTIGADHASAGDDCITESKLVPPKGSRWYHHIDRATNRKCWFLMKATTTPAAAPARVTVSPEHREPSPAGQTGLRSKRKLSESEQAALFLEFLRWKEKQSVVNSNGAESLRGTISP